MVVLRTPPYWLVRVAMERSKSTLDSLIESVFKAFRRKRSLGPPELPRGKSTVSLELSDPFLNFGSVCEKF